MNNPVGIVPNRLTADALINRASGFLVVLEDPIIPIINEIDKEYDVIRYEYKSDRHVSVRSYEEFFKEWAPVQLGQEFFIQEEFIRVSNLDKLEIRTRRDISEDEHKYIWLPASDMSYNESQFKSKPISLEIKQVQELDSNDWSNLMLTTESKWLPYHDEFIEWFNTESNIKYEDNPFVFVYELEE